MDGDDNVANNTQGQRQSPTDSDDPPLTNDECPGQDDPTMNK